MAKKILGDVIEQVVNASFDILAFRVKIAMGKYDELPENYIDFDTNEQDNILRLVQPLLTTSQQTRRICAETSKDIVKMLSKGKISIIEARELLAISGAAIEVEEKEIKLELQKTMLEMIGKED